MPAVGNFPDWDGALRYWLRNHVDLVDPATSAAPTVKPERPSGNVPSNPTPLIVPQPEPGLSHRFVPLASVRVGMFVYHSTHKNAFDLWSVLDGVLGPTRHGGSGFTVTMPVSLGSDVIRFNNVSRESTPIRLTDEGWPVYYCPYTLNIVSEVLA